MQMKNPTPADSSPKSENPGIGPKAATLLMGLGSKSTDGDHINYEDSQQVADLLAPFAKAFVRSEVGSGLKETGRVLGNEGSSNQSLSNPNSIHISKEIGLEPGPNELQ
ncbi:hypothetical protein Ancab_001445, partial [Ancistrocladus abbreviatus]